jgi:hypothetical protein
MATRAPRLPKDVLGRVGIMVRPECGPRRSARRMTRSLADRSFHELLSAAGAQGGRISMYCFWRSKARSFRSNFKSTVSLEIATELRFLSMRPNAPGKQNRESHCTRNLLIPSRKRVDLADLASRYQPRHSPPKRKAEMHAAELRMRLLGSSRG